MHPTATRVPKRLQTWLLSSPSQAMGEAMRAIIPRILHRQLARGKLAGRRAVRRRARMMKVGAEPGPSGLRNSCVRDIALDVRGSEIMARWCRTWAEGRPPHAAARLWTQAVMVGFMKTKGGVRPIALAEALLKRAEVPHLEIVAPQLRKMLEPDQLGCRAPGGSEAIPEHVVGFCGSDLSSRYD